MNSSLIIAALFAACLLRSLPASAQDTRSTAPASLGAAAAAPDYCATVKKNPARECQKDDAKVIDFVQAEKFMEKCPQKCSDLDLIKRETWGAQLAPRICDVKDSARVKNIDKVKLERGQAKCAKNPVLYSAKNAELEKMEIPDCTPPITSPTTLVIHHTTDDGFGDVSSITPKKIQRSQNRKWADIGYHFVIAMDEKHKWQVYEGRKRLAGKCSFAQGAHGGPGLNADSLGIAIAGNYEETSHPSFAGPNGEPDIPVGAIKKLMELTASLKKDCPSLKNAEGHGDHEKAGWGCVSTLCPGSGCKHLIHRIMAMLNL